MPSEFGGSCNLSALCLFRGFGLVRQQVTHTLKLARLYREAD